MKHRASQADLPRQVSELQDRLAQAEALIKPLDSTSPARDNQATAEAPWQFVTPPELDADHGGANMMPGPLHGMETGFDGFDSLANFADNVLNPWGNGINWTSITSPLPDILPVQESLSLVAPIDLDSLNSLHPSQQDFGPYSISGGSNPVEDEVSTQNLTQLHHNYFETMYHAMPILNKQRFLAEMTRRPLSSPTHSLSYGVALVGSTLLPKYAHLQRTCYSKARELVELCERNEDGAELASLDVFQTLLFIIRYELTSKQLTRAWMTLGRAITLAKMMNLQHMDTATLGGVATWDPEIQLPPMDDLTSLEEMRRSFWALYIFDCYASIRTRRPHQLDAVQIEVFLPSPGPLAHDFSPSPMPFLNDALTLRDASHASSYLAVVLMVALARLCYEHVAIIDTDTQGKGFWDRHYALVKQINEYTPLMQAHLSAKAVREDPLAFTLHINLCAVHMFLHEAAIGKVTEQDLPQLVAAESRKCSTAAAFKVLSAVRMNWPAQHSQHDFFTLQATFIGWPLVMSMEALCRSLLDSDDDISMGVTDSLRLLLAALDHVEEPDGYWHKASAGATATLEKCDERQGGWNTTH